MSWSANTNAVRVLSGSNLLQLPATSVAVIRPDMADPHLRMYGVNAFHLQNIPRYSLSAQTQVNGHYPIGYFDSGLGPNPETFRLIPGSNIITNTLIPGGRSVSSNGESVVCWDYSSTSMTPSSSQTFGPADLISVQYKDPNVLYLESIGRYMLILCRVRVFNATPASTSATPNTSISDIVAYTDSVSTFDSAPQGPYWLADSLSAMRNVNYRLWLGVPTGFEYTDGSGASFLYLYYSIGPCDLTMTSTFSPQINIAVDIPSSPGPNSYPGATFTPRLGLKIMSTSHFVAAPTVAEVDWETDHTTYLNNVVPGVFQRTVRLWMAVYGAPYQVVRFEQATSNTLPVDPAVVVDAVNGGQTSPNPRSASATLGENISLYFAANMANPSVSSVPFTGYGIWRATAVPENSGITLTPVDSGGNSNGVSVAPVFGVDWVIRHVNVGSGRFQVLGMDQVAQSTSTTDANVDPEPALLYGGSWRVFMGHGAVYTGGAVNLEYVENSLYSDAFCPIASAWF